MDYTDTNKIKEQIPELINNLNNKGNLSSFEVIQQLQLTLPAAIKLNITEGVTQIKQALFVFLAGETSNSTYNPFLPIFRLINEFRRSFSKEDKTKLYSIAYQRFLNEIKALNESREYSLHGIIELGKHLSKHYAKLQSFSEVDSILSEMINCIEASDPSMPAMRKVALYRDLVPIIRDLGRMEVLDRINKILQDNAPRIKDEMGQSTFQFGIPNDLIENDFRLMTEGFSVTEALSIFALKFVPDDSFINEYANRSKNGTDILSMFKYMYFRTDGNLSHEVDPDSDDKTAQKNQTYSTIVQLLGIFLHIIILKGQESGLFGLDNVMNFVARVPVLSEKRVRIIEKGVSAFLENDYITSISILIPQTEYLIRAYYLANGFTVTDNDKTGTTSDALGKILDNDDIIIFDKNISNYLRMILSMKTGWNIRNLYGHGIEESFSLSHADRVFHIVILMAALMQPQ